VDDGTGRDHERFAGLPSRRAALRAKDKNNLTVFLKFSVAKKLYRCPYCHKEIPIGTEHVVLGRVQASPANTHHHIDLDCKQRRLLPTLSQIQIIEPREASASAVIKRSRKYRARHRRR
jgi:hypothetical protein